MSIAVFWFRRDLRLHDNTGLFHALRSGHKVQPLFIFDKEILDKLEDRDDRRVTFLHRHLQSIDKELRSFGSSLLVLYGNPTDIWQKIIDEHPVKAVFTNHDYEPYAKVRDARIGSFLASKGVEFKTYKDQVIFEKSEVVKDDGTPYTVYTPYMKKWRARLESGDLNSYDCESHFSAFAQSNQPEMPSLEAIGFKA
ncbi:MAG: deoxyribodipyrimidine photo-lyase, partial [Flavobacteriales bacterium]